MAGPGPRRPDASRWRGRLALPGRQIRPAGRRPVRERTLQQVGLHDRGGRVTRDEQRLDLMWAELDAEAAAEQRQVEAHGGGLAGRLVTAYDVAAVILLRLLDHGDQHVVGVVDGRETVVLGQRTVVV